MAYVVLCNIKPSGGWVGQDGWGAGMANNRGRVGVLACSIPIVLWDGPIRTGQTERMARAHHALTQPGPEPPPHIPAEREGETRERGTIGAGSGALVPLKGHKGI